MIYDKLVRIIFRLFFLLIYANTCLAIYTHSLFTSALSHNRSPSLLKHFFTQYFSYF